MQYRNFGETLQVPTSTHLLPTRYKTRLNENRAGSLAPSLFTPHKQRQRSLVALVALVFGLLHARLPQTTQLPRTHERLRHFKNDTAAVRATQRPLCPKHNIAALRTTQLAANDPPLPRSFVLIRFLVITSAAPTAGFSN